MCNIEKAAFFLLKYTLILRVCKISSVFFFKWKKHVRFYCFFVWQKHNAYKYVALTDIYAIFLINEVPVNITYAISIDFGSHTEHWMWKNWFTLETRTEGIQINWYHYAYYNRAAYWQRWFSFICFWDYIENCLQLNAREYSKMKLICLALFEKKINKFIFYVKKEWKNGT